VQLITFRFRRRARRSNRPLPATVAVALAAGLATPLALVAATPAAAAGCPCTIWSATASPGQPAAADASAVEVGVKFRSDVSGYVTGVRFYKGTGNTGSHIGNLWTGTGTNLGTVAFTGESASGWQQADFGAPIAVSANTSYVVSYYAPNGHYAADLGYFASNGVDTAPLHALRDGVDGGDGSYRYGTGGGFPTNSYQATNYWVDVVFNTSITDTTPPTVTGTAPAANATGVPATTTVAATLSEPVQAPTAHLDVSSAGGPVSGSTSYDAASNTVTFTPDAALSVSTTYTATASGAADPAGNVMAPYSWSFTTAATASGCPCTIWPDSATPAVAAVSDNSAVELGVRFRTSTAGFVTGLRYYKSASNTGTHVGSLWTNTGTRLSSVTFTGETGSGWQTAQLPTPVQVTANTTYLAAYHTDTGFYSATNNGLASAVTRGPLTALANGTDGGNGGYAYGADAFPANSFQATNYWVDVVFDTSQPDRTAPTVTSRAPAPNAVGISTGGTVTATFSEPVTAATVAMALTGPGGAVPGSVSYSAATSTATFTPAAALANSTSYTAAVSGAADPSGNVMTPVSWSFSTAGPAGPPPDQGPGGPVLVVTSTATGASPFSSYTAEILRAEGLNEFATADLSAVTATVLNQYDVVLLGATPLTAAQVAMFGDWVNVGGRLVTFRPDRQLAGLLGLSGGLSTLSDQYLRVDTTTAPGAGIVGQTIQFHGTADLYSLNGARAVATLYSSANAPTASPAVSLVSVGTAGGQAAAFSYDLPRSIVYMRQGNPAWDGQDRDGSAPVRSDDLYFGGSGTDWVNLSKAAIPQADEQQRLLANLIGTMDLDRKPLPRLWYFPRGGKAVVVATGDDHGNGGTAGRFDQYAANSPAGCVVDDWQCLRFTSYIYPSTPLTNAQAAAYNASGFEVGLHPQNNCANFTPTSLESDYASQLSQWAQKYTSLPPPSTSRYHCIVWSDWATQAVTERNHGIRLDTNYYYWPDSWVADRPGFMTGSGMPMRFAAKTGDFIDVYQAATQLTDESGQSYPFTPNTLLDNATGPLGYYGVFTSNMHTDVTTTFEDDQLLASAVAHGVPVVTARQLLSWLDGRNGSSFGGIGWNGSTLSFTMNIGTGANGLTAMVPTVGPGGSTLTGLTLGGNAVAYTTATIKGVGYAMFQAAPGSYAAVYGSSGSSALLVSVQQVSPQSAALNVSYRPTTSTEVSFGTSPSNLDRRVVDGTRASLRRLTLSGLRPATTYHYRVSVTGPDHQRATATTGTFTTRAADVTAPALSGPDTFPLPDQTAAVSWRTSEDADGTLLIGSRPGALTAYREGATGRSHTVGVSGLRPDTTYYYRVRSADAAGNATVWPAPGSPPARFVTAAYGVADRTGQQFRMSRGGAGLTVHPDGLGVLSLAASGGAGTREGPGVDSRAVGTSARPGPGASAWYVTSGSMVSRVLDAGQMVTWDRLSYRADLPLGTVLRISVRTGSTSTPDATWSGWSTVRQGGRVTGSSRYVQYRVQMWTARPGATPVLRGVGITSSGMPLRTPTEE
jgi:hypothetical protein